MENVKKLLRKGGYTCVLCKEGKLYTSTLRGVKPLVQWLTAGTELAGCTAADKVVGKATAFLYVLLKADAVYAEVISRSALAVLKSHGIRTEYAALAENIVNRRGDGICPFEAAVLDIEDPQLAYARILHQMDAMGISL